MATNGGEDLWSHIVVLQRLMHAWKVRSKAWKARLKTWKVGKFIRNLSSWHGWRTLSMVFMKTTQCEEFKQPLLEKKVVIYCATNVYILKNVSSKLCQVCRFLHWQMKCESCPFWNYRRIHWCKSTLLRPINEVFVISCTIPPTNLEN
jgi:hypothetical protein